VYLHSSSAVIDLVANYALEKSTAPANALVLIIMDRFGDTSVASLILKLFVYGVTAALSLVATAKR